jgi:hypothetical protein
VDRLAPEGIVVASIPNVTHGAVRLSLVEGRFAYTERGLLDRTHLRFFDRRGAEDLLANAGLVIAERLRVQRGLEETEIPVHLNEVAPDLIEALLRDADALTYQFVFVGRPAARTTAPVPGAMLAESLLAETEQLRARLGEVEQYAMQLAADRKDAGALADVTRDRDDLRDELGRRMAELHRQDLELKHRKADIAVKEAFIDDLREELQAAAAGHADELSATQARLLRTTERLRALEAERDHMAAEMNALRTYAGSTGFRLMEGVLVRLRRVPFLMSAGRRIARALAGRRDPPA